MRPLAEISDAILCLFVFRGSHELFYGPCTGISASSILCASILDSNSYFFNLEGAHVAHKLRNRAVKQMEFNKQNSQCK